MKQVILLILLTLIIPFTGQADDTVKKQIKKDLIQQFKVGTYQLGKKYIIAIPPNETASFPWMDSAIEVYVAAATNTDVDISVFGKLFHETIKANDVLVIDDNMALYKQSAEIREPNNASDKTITISADSPISVYVMNSKATTSDGYMAIPVEHWGKEYTHCSYYDNYESKINKFSGGFLVLGSEKNTKVDVELRGIGKNIATLKNRTETIGDRFTFDIGAGQVYQIETDGLTRGEYDITGTKISSNKPIGVISYHWRAVIPILMNSSRDHLSEMIPSNRTLGNTYASVATERNGSDRGDLFRLVAINPQTSYEVKWYDCETKKVLGTKLGILKEAGEFHDISPALYPDTSAQGSITGTSVFEADKPILLMQYSYSGGWDESMYDPFMWVVTPQEQYVTHAIVQAPANKSFAENFINIIAYQDPSDPTKAGLLSLEFDGIKVVNKVPSLTNNQIPGTNLYWARFAIAPGPHTITGNGDVKFGSYIYGFKAVDSYGWPAALASRPLDEVDEMPPSMSYDNVNNNSGSWEIHIEDNRTSTGGNINAKDSKIWFEPLAMIYDNYGLNTYNFNEPSIDFDWKYGAHDDYTVTLEVTDEYREAEANFYVADYAGNITLGNLKYFPNLMVINNEDETDFDEVAVDDKVTHTLEFRNTSKVNYNLTSVEIIGNDAFSIDPEKLPAEVELGSTFSIDVEYAPSSNSTNDQAELVIKTDNLIYTWELNGQAFSDEETLAFENPNGLDFGSVLLNQTSTQSVNVNNSGEVDIEIISISLVDDMYFHADNSANGTTLGVGEDLSIDVTYAPVDVIGKETDTLIIETAKKTYKYSLEGTADEENSVLEASRDLVSISPNPIQGNASIKINLPIATHLKARLYGTEGQLVKVLFDGMCEQGEKSFNLSTTGIASGTYSLTIEFDNKKYVTQVIISK